jgi:hypothetical protein
VPDWSSELVAVEVANADSVDNLRNENSEKKPFTLQFIHTSRFLPDFALKHTMVVLVPDLPTFGYR